MTAQGQQTNAPAERSVRRALEGTVTSNAMAKTITVEVERTYKHGKYGKFVRKAKKYHAHDEKGEAGKGDRVEIMACRPYSRTKRWRLVRIIEKSKLVDAVQFDAQGQVATEQDQVGTAPTHGAAAAQKGGGA
jgi:small subunit ribosomal protein S17